MGSSSCLSRSGVFKIPEEEPPASLPKPLCQQQPRTLLVGSAPFPVDLWFVGRRQFWVLLGHPGVHWRSRRGEMLMQKRCPVPGLMQGTVGAVLAGQEDPLPGQSPSGWPWGENPCPRPSHPPRTQSIQALQRQICSSKVPLQGAGGQGAARGRPAVPVPALGRVRWRFGGGFSGGE